LNRFRNHLFLTFIFVFSAFSNLCPFWPIIGLGVGVPIFGGVASAKSLSAKQVFYDVEVVLLYVKLFLLFATFLSLIILSIWLLNFIKKRRSKFFFDQVIKLFSRLQADLSFIKSSSSLTEDQLKLAKISKNKLIDSLFKNFENKFFVKNIDYHLMRRMLDSLEIIKRDEVSVDEQIKLVDQWGNLIKRFLTI